MTTPDTGLDELRRQAETRLANCGNGTPDGYLGIEYTLDLLTAERCTYASAYLPNPCRLRPGHLTAHDCSEAPA